MSDMNDLATAASAIADPTTSAADLATIAEIQPSLRTAVALHPNVYPGLLDWLDGLGDPTLSRAVASRRAKDSGTSVSTPPVAPAYGGTSGYAAVSAMASTNVGTDGVAGVGTYAGVSSAGVASTSMGANGYAEPPYPKDAYSPTPQERAARNARRGAIAAAVLFCVGAILEFIALAVDDFYYCRDLTLILYPWGWSSGITALCSSNSSTTAGIFSIVTLLALIGCGVVSLVIGRKDFKQAAFLIGAVLSVVTVISTMITFVNLSDYRGAQSFTVIFSLLFLAVPVVLVLMSKMTLEKVLQPLKAASLAIMGFLFIGIALYLNYRYFGFIIGFFSESGNIPLFAALIVLVFTFPAPSPQETATPGRNMLLVTSALVISEGACYLLLIIYSYFSVYNTLIAAYIVAAGVVGLVFMGNRSKASLLVGLGIGLIVAQVVWFILSNLLYRGYYGYWIDTLVYLLGFLTVSIVYLVAATKMNKNPAAALAGQAYMGEQPYVPGQPYPVQQYAGAPQPPQPYMVGQPQPYGVPQYGVYDTPNAGYAVLGFFVPLVGLILYLTWKDQTPLRAKSAGKGALIGVIVSVALTIIYFIVIAIIFSSVGGY